MNQMRDLDPVSVLVVSEDPEFIVRLQDRFRDRALRIYACLGPAQTPCRLKDQGRCPLVESVDMVVVDSPRSGAFVERGRVISAGGYATRLARAYPDLFVVLCDAPLALFHKVPPEVARVSDRDAAVDLLTWLAGPAQKMRDRLMDRIGA